jgi:hypothetical protein
LLGVFRVASGIVDRVGPINVAVLLRVALLVSFSVPLAGQSRPPSRTIQIRVDGQQSYKQLLLNRLRADVKNQNIDWEEAAVGFEYRIAFDVQTDTNLRLSWCTAKSTLFGENGKKLFQFTTGAWTCMQAVDSVASGILERLRRLRPELLKSE